jgi:hypothetical protein
LRYSTSSHRVELKSITALCEILREAQEDTDATVLVTVASGDADSVLGSEEPFVRQLVAGATSGPLQLRDT